MKKFVLFGSLLTLSLQLVAVTIGSIDEQDIQKINRTDKRGKVMYEASYESKTQRGTSEGSVVCWKNKKGTIGCTENATIIQRSGANVYSRPIADANFAKLEELYSQRSKSK